MYTYIYIYEYIYIYICIYIYIYIYIVFSTPREHLPELLDDCGVLTLEQVMPTLGQVIRLELFMSLNMIEPRTRYKPMIGCSPRTGYAHYENLGQLSQDELVSI